MKNHSLNPFCVRANSSWSATLVFAVSLVLAPLASAQSGPKEFFERLNPFKSRETRTTTEIRTQVPSSFTAPSDEVWTPIGSGYATPSSEYPGSPPPARQGIATPSPNSSTVGRGVPSADPVVLNTTVDAGFFAPSPSPGGTPGSAPGTTRAGASRGSVSPAPYTVNQRAFQLPFDDLLRSLPAGHVKEVRLYASPNKGQTWSHYKTLTAQQMNGMSPKVFQVLTGKDGEYWFSLRVVNMQNQELSATQSPWRILVATQGGTGSGSNSLAGSPNASTPPASPPLSGTNGVARPQWSPTPDGAPTTTPAHGGTPPQNPNVVVFSIKDANSPTIPDTSLNVYKIQGSAPVGSDEKREVSAAKPELGTLSTEGGDVGGLSGENSGGSAEGELLLSVPEPEDAVDAKIRYLRTPRLEVEYDVATVGPSGVGRIELWGTLDGGQTWSFLTEDKDLASPVVVDLKADGEYGLTLQVFNGAGVGADRPAAGTLPQMHVVLDRINPRVQFQSIQLVADFGELEIRWVAEDSHLGTNPVTLSWSSTTEGPWRAMTSAPLENLGFFSWRIPSDLPGKVFIRIDVADLAKNSTTLVTGPVVTDLVRPTASIRDARPSAK
ncbi:MAG: hypothetical protein Q4D38_09505 [Planctomycetia bacterium]|nr:hypothetical protein [Planctomycetia bacterium]